MNCLKVALDSTQAPLRLLGDFSVRTARQTQKRDFAVIVAGQNGHGAGEKVRNNNGLLRGRFIVLDDLKHIECYIFLVIDAVTARPGRCVNNLASATLLRDRNSQLVNDFFIQLIAEETPETRYALSGSYRAVINTAQDSPEGALRGDLGIKGCWSHTAQLLHPGSR
ncbi:hypothetical protein SBA2_900016 [Acidobacteriia bacterium SbA2]|nr:hypothetical protein SBA2_900016 [Acidobacteriia bacterium SbA2]